jgi:hypothetical protein
MQKTSNNGWLCGLKKPLLQTRKRQRVGGCNRIVLRRSKGKNVTRSPRAMV